MNTICEQIKQLATASAAKCTESSSKYHAVFHANFKKNVREKVEIFTGMIRIFEMDIASKEHQLLSTEQQIDKRHLRCHAIPKIEIAEKAIARFVIIVERLGLLTNYVKAGGNSIKHDSYIISEQEYSEDDDTDTGYTLEFLKTISKQNIQCLLTDVKELCSVNVTILDDIVNAAIIILDKSDQDSANSNHTAKISVDLNFDNELMKLSLIVEYLLRFNDISNPKNTNLSYLNSLLPKFLQTTSATSTESIFNELANDYAVKIQQNAESAPECNEFESSESEKQRHDTLIDQINKSKSNCAILKGVVERLQMELEVNPATSEKK